MKYLLLLLSALCISNAGVGQTLTTVRFLDLEGRSALDRIAMSFYANPLAPETTCTEAFCSVTFLIMRSSQIDSIQFSPGVPSEIIHPMTEALKATAEYWALDQKAPLRVIIPLHIVPSGLCQEKDRIGLYFQTASQMFDYGKPFDAKVNRATYWQKATTMVEGLLLPPMLVKGRINDVYLVNPPKK